MSISNLHDANFTPPSGNYNSLKPFRFWCQKILPLVYDDSMSYYEVLAKLTGKLNEVIETFNNDIRENVYEYMQSDEFKTWLKAYIQSRKIEISSLAVIGDSNAEGYGWWEGNRTNKTNENDGYCAILRELYPESTIDNYSLSGATLRGENEYSGKAQCDALINSGKSYDYVIIQLGMNDMNNVMETYNNVVGYCPTLRSSAVQITNDYSTCVKSLCSIINRIRTYSPTTKIIYLAREYQAVGSPWFYPVYCAFFKQIFDTCYLMSIPILNLETNYINTSNSEQKEAFYYDTIHWGERAYREYVTPRIIEFIDNPVSSGLIGNDYLFLCCSINDIIRGNNNNNYEVSDNLRNALDYIRTDSPYLSFHGAFIMTINAGNFMFGDITSVGASLLAKLRNVINNQNITVFRDNNSTDYWVENVTKEPTMDSNMSYAGAEAESYNVLGYGSVPAHQAVFHEAYNDNNGKLTRLMTGAKIGKIMSVYDAENDERKDFYLGGMLGAQGTISLADERVQSGVYYVPSHLLEYITLGVPDEYTIGYGYTLIVNKRTSVSNVSIIFALTATGIYYMINNSGTWIKCAGV